MQEEINRLNLVYVLSAITIIIIILYIAASSQWNYFTNKHAELNPNESTKPKNTILVKTQKGPRYVNRHKLKVFLEKIKAKIHKIYPQAGKYISNQDKHDNLLVAMPLFDKNYGPNKKHIQQQYLIKKAVENLQEFAAVNNPDLRRDFCEVRFNGGPTDAIEKLKILKSIEQNNTLQKQMLETADESELQMLLTKLEFEMEHILYVLSKSSFICTDTIVDLRIFELLLPDLDYSEITYIKPTNLLPARLSDVNTTETFSPQYLHAAKKKKGHSDVEIPITRMEDNIELTKSPTALPVQKLTNKPISQISYNSLCETMSPVAAEMNPGYY